MKAVCFRVTGRVQGVGYRAAVVRLADRCAVDGWVRNVDDASVQGVVLGVDDEVDAFLAGLPAAAARAQVDRVEVSAIEPPELETGFVLRPDAHAPTDDWA
jgi:acylphosphatase